MRRIRKPHFFLFLQAWSPKVFAFLVIHQLPSYCVLNTLSPRLIPSAMVVVSPLPVNKMSAHLDPFYLFDQFLPGESEFYLIFCHLAIFEINFIPIV